MATGSSLGCPGEDVCALLRDDVSAHDIEKTLGSMAMRWRWLLLGLPPAAAAVVAPFLAATGEALGAPGVTVGGLLAATRAISAPSAVTAAFHAAEHLHSAAGRALADAGFIEPQTGVVAELFAGKGLPKPAIGFGEVWRRGLRDDVQRETKHHGRPSQALCLWSGEVVDALLAEGHPIAPGAAGENLSIRGIDWAKVRPGSIATTGSLRFELSGWALPCAKNRRLFLPGPDGTKPELRIDPDRHPGSSRAYAYVLTDRTCDVIGTLQPGDAITFG